MDPIYLPKLIAWIATVLCVIASSRSATVFAKQSPRVFTILALFALNWAILIPYYSESAPPELIAGFAGFLLVYVGVLLRREARDRLANNKESASSSSDPASIKSESEVGREDRLAVWVLRLLIAPSLISLPFPTGVLNRSITEPVIGSFITLLGYYSVWSALRIYSSNRKGQRLMTAIIIPYALIDFAFSIYLILVPRTPCPTPPDFWRDKCSPMGPVFLILFATLKMLFSVAFIYLVLDESLSDEDRKLSTIDKLLKFAGM